MDFQLPIPISKYALHHLLVILSVTIVTGCNSWTSRSSDYTKPNLPQLSESSKSMVLEVEFLPIEANLAQTDGLASLWQWADETVLENQIRKDWLNNGLRIGRVLDEQKIRQQLDVIRSSETAVDQFLVKAKVASDVGHGVERVPMRWGRRYELPARQPLAGERVTLLRLNEQTTGQTLTDPQFLFAMTATPGIYPKQASLRLRPEIQHGHMKQKWVSSDNALRMDHRRDTWSLKELEWELTGKEGDMFIISGVLPIRGVGGQMLSGISADQKEHLVVLLLKLAKVPAVTE